MEHIESDHNLINTQFKLTWTPTKNKVMEVFKYDDKASLDKFKLLTTETKHLSNVIDMKKSIHVVTRQTKILKG